MPVRWTHLTAAVSDVDRSIEFYTSMCNLSLLRDRRPDGGSTVWLGPKPKDGEYPTFLLVLAKGEVTARLDHLGFQCESREEVDEIAKLAKEKGILVEPPTDAGGVVGYFMMLSDPDGHLVEFTFGQPLKGL